MLTLLVVHAGAGDAALREQAQHCHEGPHAEDEPREPTRHGHGGAQVDALPNLEHTGKYM